MGGEDKKEYDRLRYLAKKDHILMMSKKYYRENSERMRSVKKKYTESKRHNPSVYCLPNENYIGTTENIKSRLKNHKYKGKDTSDWYIVSEFKDRKEALELEKEYHNKGYAGRHSQNTYQ